MTDLRTAKPVLVLIERIDAPGRYLCEFNDNWRAVMFPVTRPREFQDDRWGVSVAEKEIEAAGRAACEATGQLVRKSSLETLGELHITGLSQSGGEVTSYNFSVYRLQIAKGAALQGPQPVYWLTPEEIVDPDLTPISPIARKLAQALLESELNNRVR